MKIMEHPRIHEENPDIMHLIAHLHTSIVYLAHDSVKTLHKLIKLALVCSCWLL